MGANQAPDQNMPRVLGPTREIALTPQDEARLLEKLDRTNGWFLGLGGTSSIPPTAFDALVGLEVGDQGEVLSDGSAQQCNRVILRDQVTGKTALLHTDLGSSLAIRSVKEGEVSFPRIVTEAVNVIEFSLARLGLTMEDVRSAPNRVEACILRAPGTTETESRFSEAIQTVWSEALRQKGIHQYATDVSPTWHDPYRAVLFVSDGLVIAVDPRNRTILRALSLKPSPAESAVTTARAESSWGAMSKGAPSVPVLATDSRRKEPPLNSIGPPAAPAAEAGLRPQEFGKADQDITTLPALKQPIRLSAPRQFFRGVLSFAQRDLDAYLQAHEASHVQKHTNEIGATWAGFKAAPVSGTLSLLTLPARLLSDRINSSPWVQERQQIRDAVWRETGIRLTASPLVSTAYLKDAAILLGRLPPETAFTVRRVYLHFWLFIPFLTLFSVRWGSTPPTTLRMVAGPGRTTFRRWLAFRLGLHFAQLYKDRLPKLPRPVLGMLIGNYLVGDIVNEPLMRSPNPMMDQIHQTVFSGQPDPARLPWEKRLEPGESGSIGKPLTLMVVGAAYAWGVTSVALQLPLFLAVLPALPVLIGFLNLSSEFALTLLAERVARVTLRQSETKPPESSGFWGLRVLYEIPRAAAIVLILFSGRHMDMTNPLQEFIDEFSSAYELVWGKPNLPSPQLANGRIIKLVAPPPSDGVAGPAVRTPYSIPWPTDYRIAAAPGSPYEDSLVKSPYEIPKEDLWQTRGAVTWIDVSAGKIDSLSEVKAFVVRIGRAEAGTEIEVLVRVYDSKDSGLVYTLRKQVFEGLESIEITSDEILRGLRLKGIAFTPKHHPRIQVMVRFGQGREWDLPRVDGRMPRVEMSRLDIIPAEPKTMFQRPPPIPGINFLPLPNLKKLKMPQEFPDFRKDANVMAPAATITPRTAQRQDIGSQNRRGSTFLELIPLFPAVLFGALHGIKLLMAHHDALAQAGRHIAHLLQTIPGGSVHSLILLVLTIGAGAMYLGAHQPPGSDPEAPEAETSLTEDERWISEWKPLQAYAAQFGMSAIPPDVCRFLSALKDPLLNEPLVSVARKLPSDEQGKTTLEGGQDGFIEFMDVYNRYVESAFLKPEYSDAFYFFVGRSMDFVIQTARAMVAFDPRFANFGQRMVLIDYSRDKFLVPYVRRAVADFLWRSFRSTGLEPRHVVILDDVHASFMSDTISNLQENIRLGSDPAFRVDVEIVSEAELPGLHPSHVDRAGTWMGNIDRNHRDYSITETPSGLVQTYENASKFDYAFNYWDTDGYRKTSHLTGREHYAAFRLLQQAVIAAWVWQHRPRPADPALARRIPNWMLRLWQLVARRSPPKSEIPHADPLVERNPAAVGSAAALYPDFNAIRHPRIEPIWGPDGNFTSADFPYLLGLLQGEMERFGKGGDTRDERYAAKDAFQNFFAKAVFNAEAKKLKHIDFNLLLSVFRPNLNEYFEKKRAWFQYLDNLGTLAASGDANAQETLDEFQILARDAVAASFEGDLYIFGQPKKYSWDSDHTFDAPARLMIDDVIKTYEPCRIWQTELCKEYLIAHHLSEWIAYIWTEYQNKNAQKASRYLGWLHYAYPFYFDIVRVSLEAMGSSDQGLASDILAAHRPEASAYEQFPGPLTMIGEANVLIANHAPTDTARQAGLRFIQEQTHTTQNDIELKPPVGNKNPPAAPAAGSIAKRTPNGFAPVVIMAAVGTALLSASHGIQSLIAHHDILAQAAAQHPGFFLNVIMVLIGVLAFMPIGSSRPVWFAAGQTTHQNGGNGGDVLTECGGFTLGEVVWHQDFGKGRVDGFPNSRDQGRLIGVQFGAVPEDVAGGTPRIVTFNLAQAQRELRRSAPGKREARPRAVPAARKPIDQHGTADEIVETMLSSESPSDIANTGKAGLLRTLERFRQRLARLDEMGWRDVLSRAHRASLEKLDRLQQRWMVSHAPLTDLVPQTVFWLYFAAEEIHVAVNGRSDLSELVDQADDLLASVSELAGPIIRSIWKEFQNNSPLPRLSNLLYDRDPRAPELQSLEQLIAGYHKPNFWMVQSIILVGSNPQVLQSYLNELSDLVTAAKQTPRLAPYRFRYRATTLRRFLKAAMRRAA